MNSKSENQYSFTYISKYIELIITKVINILIQKQEKPTIPKEGLPTIKTTKAKKFKIGFDTTFINNNKIIIGIILLALILTHYLTAALDTKEKPILVDTSETSRITEEDFKHLSRDRVVTHYDCSNHADVEMYTTMEVENCDVRS